jgi:hypothetical protein
MDMGQKTESIGQLVEDISKSRVALPEFQRDFVWEIQKTFDLFDSFVRDIFAGSLIYGVPSFEITVRELDKRPRSGKGSKAKLKNAKLFREIAELAVEEPGLAVLPFSDEALRNDVERYGRLLSLESGSWPVLAPPKQAEWDLFQRNVAAALSLIEETDGGLASEFYALVTQIVGMGAPQKSDGYGYAGDSSFMLWGAIMLSIRQHNTVLDMIAGLIHEAAHLLLFGLSVDNPFVENAVHERFSSPLRIDPRPMDGVFHATFVCARMHYAFARLLRASATLSQPLETALIERRVADCRSGFFDGYETVQRFGRLTANGQVILTAAAEYMQTPENNER